MIHLWYSYEYIHICTGVYVCMIYIRYIVVLILVYSSVSSRYSKKFILWQDFESQFQIMNVIRYRFNDIYRYAHVFPEYFQL